MTTWCHLPTIFDRRRTLLIPALTSLIVVLFTALIFAHAAGATAGINKTVNFQGRLLNTQGATVPDGYYNIQFKIYQDGDGQSTGDSTGSPAGSLKWTETYINNNAQAGVQVKNGFLSVNLGSQTAFGSSIDWNQDTLWLSMNIAGSDNGCTTYNAGTCPADGEMTPMKRLTATPYALNSGALNGLTSSNFVQLAQGVQTDASTNTSSIFINKTSTGNLLQLQSSGTDAFTLGNAGDLSFGNNANHTLSVTTAGASTAGKSLTVSSGTGGSGTGSVGGDLVLQGGAAGGTNANGGNITIDAGAKTGSGTDGAISLGTSHASTINIGSIGSSANTTTVHIADSTGAAQTITIGGTNSGSNTTIKGGGYSVATTNTGVAVSGSGTGNSLSVTSSANPAGGTNALIVANNTNGTASGNLIALQNAGANKFTVDASGNTIASGNLKYVDTGVSATAIVCKDASGYLTACNTTGNGAAFIQGGNNFGADAVIGSTGASQQLTFKTAGTNRLTLDATGSNLTFLQAASINTNGALALTLDTGGAAALSLGTANTNALSIGNTSGSFTAESNGTANLFNGNTAHTIQMATASGTTQTVTIGSTNSSSKTTIQGGAYSLVTRNTGVGINTGANAPTADLTFGDNGGSGRSINVLQRTSNAAGDALTISAGQGGSGASANAGGALNLNGGAASGTGNAAGGDVNINGGAKNASGTDGNINIGTTRANNVNIQATNQTTITTNSIQRATFDNAGNLFLGNGTSSATQTSFTIQGTGTTNTGIAGGTLTVQGGTGGATSGNGGNLTLSGGAGTGTGVSGLVVLNTTTYSTATTQSSGSNVNVTQANIDSFGAIILNATATGVNFTLSSPTLGSNAAGRLIYVTAANGSNDFTLRANVGGGTGVEQNISMRQNTTATMIWNGSQWTAAGASSSTTLQAAYDNTLQSAGGAELVVSKTSATNGLTIRDSSVNSVNGTLLQVQSKTAANIFSVSSNVSDYASDNGAETAGGSSSTFPSSTWAATGSATVTRNTTTNNNTIATGQASVSVVTSTSVNSGVSNQIIDPTAGSAVALTASTQYNVSLSARLPSGAGIFNNLTVLYQYDGTSTHTVTCTSGVSIAQTSWTKINCSFTTPSSGITSANIIRIEQANSGTARTFYVDNLSVTIAAGQNYATDGGVDSALGTNWVAVGGSATQSTTNGFTASDSAQVTTTASSTSGIKNKLSANPIASTASTTYLYLISVEVQTQVTALTNFTIQYAYDGSTMTNCLDYNTQAVSTSSTQWTKITCMIQTPTNAPTTPYVFFTQGDTTVRTSSLFIDAFSMTLANSTTPDVQIGSGTNGGPVTLFTLDSAASAPIAANNASLYGSMYYDTTQGKIQCYQLSGWGSCGASPDDIVTISPEYTNAVMHGTGVGTMTSDFCSDLLNINNSVNPPVVCGTNETYNFYKWTSPQATAQTYSIYVTYQLPGTFKGFTSGATSLQGKTDSANSTVQYSIYKNSGSGLTRCGTTTVPVSTGVQTSWQTGVATGAIDPSTCSFSSGNSILFKIDVTSSSNANAYVGNLNFTFSNR